MTSVIHCYCTLCRSRCVTLKTSVDGDQVLSVEPDPSHPTGIDRIGGNRVRRGPFYQGVNAWGKLSNEPSGWRVGECESCALHIVSGSVRYLNGVESDDSSVCLTCSAVPASNLVLDA
jgi:hypothetical protein